MEALNDGKENRQISLNNGRSKSPYAVESLLLLDNTLLCNIESDNGLYVSVDTHQPFQEHNETMQVSKESLQNVAINATASPKISFSVSPNVNEWQDKTLMNQIFAQFDSQNEEEINSESYNNISNYDIFDTFCKEDTKSDLDNVDQNVEKADQLYKNVLHQDKLMGASCLHITNFGDNTLEDNDFKKDDRDSSPILKTKSRPLNECKILKKKLRFSNDVSKETKHKTDFTNCSSFYGLPDTVKRLIQKVKGICELYRKFAIIYK